MDKTVRHRVNVSTSVKNVHTFEATVEIEGGTLEEVLSESDRLVAELDMRYPKQEDSK